MTVRTLLQSASGLSGPYTTSRTFVLCFPTTSTPHASQPLLAQPHNGTARTAPPRTHRARGTNSVQLDSLNSPRGPRPRTAPTPSEKSHETSYINHSGPMIPSHQFSSHMIAVPDISAPYQVPAPQHLKVTSMRMPDALLIIHGFSLLTHTPTCTHRPLCNTVPAIATHGQPVDSLDICSAFNSTSIYPQITQVYSG